MIICYLSFDLGIAEMHKIRDWTMLFVWVWFPNIPNVKEYILCIQIFIQTAYKLSAVMQM